MFEHEHVGRSAYTYLDTLSVFRRRFCYNVCLVSIGSLYLEETIGCVADATWQDPIS